MSAKPLVDRHVWLVAGSQQLYGDEVIARVDADAREIAGNLDALASIPVRVVARQVVTSADAIRRLCLDANADDSCVGLVVWMHTFSPARMWIAGLRSLQKPLLHLHTQFNRELPWSEIDMDFMNLNQSAHGDREFGYIATRMGVRRKTVAGHWQERSVQNRIATWARAGCGWAEAQTLSVARFGDNMREVAVTEGKRSTRRPLRVRGERLRRRRSRGCASRCRRTIGDGAADEYADSYRLADELQAGGIRRESLVEAARIELALRSFLDSHGCAAFTDTFEDLHGLGHCRASRTAPDGGWVRVRRRRRLEGRGTRSDREGDERGAARRDVVHGGLHLRPHTRLELVLGAHMLEIVRQLPPRSPRAGSPVVDRWRRGSRAARVRRSRRAGSRRQPRRARRPVPVHRQRGRCDRAPDELPKLPVARAVWKPRPDFETAAEGWLAAGGSHHTVFTSALGLQAFTDLAEIAAVELVSIAGR